MVVGVELRGCWLCLVQRGWGGMCEATTTLSFGEGEKERENVVVYWLLRLERGLQIQRVGWIAM